jgi:hypothetical protein
MAIYLPRRRRLSLGAESVNALLKRLFGGCGWRSHFAREPRDGRIEGRKRVLAGQLALIAAALFTAAAVYVNVAEQPARLGLDDRALLAEWKAAYHRGFAMQGPLAIIGFSLGLIAARAEMDWRWVAGAFMLLANLAFHAHCRLADEQALAGNPAAKCGPEKP